MQLELQDEIVRRAEASAGELRIALAVQLYADNRIDYDDACALARLPKDQFSRELILRQLSIQHYSIRPAGQPPRRSAG